jgi:hypothetical protein
MEVFQRVPKLLGVHAELVGQVAEERLRRPEVPFAALPAVAFRALPAGGRRAVVGLCSDAVGGGRERHCSKEHRCYRCF